MINKKDLMKQTKREFTNDEINNQQEQGTFILNQLKGNLLPKLKAISKVNVIKESDESMLSDRSVQSQRNYTKDFET